MKFVTQTRFKMLEDLVQMIPGLDERSYALHLLKSIRSDIDDNYAEIQNPISLSCISRRSDEKNNSVNKLTEAFPSPSILPNVKS
jgi:hypothetical protein